MNRTVLVALSVWAAATLIVGCGDDAMFPDSTQGRFMGNFEGTNYDVPVTCSFLGSGFFQFLSDDTDINDTNMDGLIISGFERNNGDFVLTIIDGGTTYSTGGVDAWSISGSTVSGNGILFEDGGGPNDMGPVTFTVDC